MTIVITAFERSPDGGKGLARDMRVRWPLEEVGQPCCPRRSAAGIRTGFRRPMGDQRRQSASRLTTFCIRSPTSRAGSGMANSAESVRRISLC